MRTYIGSLKAADPAEFEEVPVGIDRDLFQGPLTYETPESRAARLDVARQVVTDLRQQGKSGDEIAAWDALYAGALACAALFTASARTARTGESAKAVA
ncbi:hypothetical protein IPZ58_15330 [Streptomyces roseoverticillatus]|uniref:hypothetical protein n=1 Tax=Streptomyces roseoverticillatus TaxID=66429 RepID=UPI001F1C74D5|nr:hypothetical protein [Streptomyces roseoverticillatus]MCF3102952.1 hypothetical protein [Streptomyces roseoverticillatus]